MDDKQQKTLRDVIFHRQKIFEDVLNNNGNVSVVDNTPISTLGVPLTEKTRVSVQLITLFQINLIGDSDIEETVVKQAASVLSIPIAIVESNYSPYLHVFVCWYPEGDVFYEQFLQTINSPHYIKRYGKSTLYDYFALKDISDDSTRNTLIDL